MKSWLRLKRDVDNASIEVAAFEIVCRTLRATAQPGTPDGLAIMQRQLGMWQRRLVKARQDLAGIHSSTEGNDEA